MPQLVDTLALFISSRTGAESSVSSDFRCGSADRSKETDNVPWKSPLPRLRAQSAYPLLPPPHFARLGTDEPMRLHCGFTDGFSSALRFSCHPFLFFLPSSSPSLKIDYDNEIIAIIAIRPISTISGTQSRRVRRSYLPNPLFHPGLTCAIHA